MIELLTVLLFHKFLFDQNQVLSKTTAAGSDRTYFCRNGSDSPSLGRISTRSKVTSHGGGNDFFREAILTSPTYVFIIAALSGLRVGKWFTLQNLQFSFGAFAEV